ncbi:MAG: TCP-1/cpn60 chaperonin family protein [Methylocystis sp.]
MITVEEAKSLETETDIVEGMQFDRGYLSPYFITNAEKMIAELDDPYILIHEKKLDSAAAAADPRSGRANGKPCSSSPRTSKARRSRRSWSTSCAAASRSPPSRRAGFGDRRKAMLEDIAILTGGQLIAEDLGIKLENVTLAMLGRAKRVRIEKENTTIIDGAGEKKDIEARISQIKGQIEETTSDYDREKLQERLAKLAGGVAVIRVGGATEVEVKEKKDRRRRRPQRHPRGGRGRRLPGGGVALLRAIKALGGVKVGNPDQQTGVDIVRKAIQAPARQIVDNAGGDGAVVVGKLLESGEYGYGFDAQKGEYGDLMKLGIIDPTKVVRTALQDAASIAGLIITTEATITEAPKKEAPPAMPGGGMGGMDF